MPRHRIGGSSNCVASRLKAALVGGARLGGGRKLIIPLFVVSGDFSLRRLLNVQALGLGLRFPRELGAWRIGDNQAKSSSIRRGLVKDHAVLRVSPTSHRGARFDFDLRRCST